MSLKVSVKNLNITGYKILIMPLFNSKHNQRVWTMFEIVHTLC